MEQRFVGGCAKAWVGARAAPGAVSEPHCLLLRSAWNHCRARHGCSARREQREEQQIGRSINMRCWHKRA